jgi:hypothetical protein
MIAIVMILLVFNSILAGCAGDNVDYKQQIEDMESEYEDTNKTLSEIQTELAEKNLELAEKDSQIIEINSELNNLSTLNLDLEDKNNNSQRVILELKNLLNASEGNRGILLEEIDYYDANIDFLEERIVQNYVDMMNLNLTMAALYEWIEMSHINDSLFTESINNLLEQVEQLEEEIIQFESIMENQSSLIIQLEIELIILNNTIFDLNNTITNLIETTHQCGEYTTVRSGQCISNNVVWGRIPFTQGTNVTFGQAYMGSWTHQDDLLYSVDFPMDEGTPIVAYRPGVIREIKEDSNINCIDEEISQENCTHGNYVLVDQGDFTFTLYLHLQQWSIDVEVGDSVGMGHQIGRVGNTGYSTDPHLHMNTKNGFSSGNSKLMLFEELINISNGMPFSGLSVNSDNYNSSIINLISPSTCPSNIFTYRGVIIDSQIPCSMASHDVEYNLTGYVASSDMDLQIAQFISSSETWSYTCVDTSNTGYFSTILEWESSIYGEWSYLMISATADDDCYAYDGWWTSIGITMI